MGGDQFEAYIDKGDVDIMNETITYNVLQAALNCGVRDFVICPGGRNSSFIDMLRVENRIQTYYWPEERSAAFFALGRSRQTHRPVAVIVTSGTACGELLPAAMEAYYSGVPLLLITADRPRRFRGSGAPQVAEQVGLFGQYARFIMDIHSDHPFDLSKWDQRAPAHLNVCLEESHSRPPHVGERLNFHSEEKEKIPFDLRQCSSTLDRFLNQIEKPLVIVSTLDEIFRVPVAQFLLKLNSPVYLEGTSGLREDVRLQRLRIKNTEKIIEYANKAGYAIDGVLRIGGIPTNRMWRDLENLKNQIKVCSISALAFSGLSWNRNVVCAPIDQFLKNYSLTRSFDIQLADQWLTADLQQEELLLELFSEEPNSEPALMHFLSKTLPDNGNVYLGNSLPIREWDMSADSRDRGLKISASRGLNGIDGQIATFLGLAENNRENWAILGDLTTLYDMAGFWILPQLEASSASIAIINNGGGKIFERMFPHKENLNCHSLHFEPLAKMWGLEYLHWDKDSRPPNLLGNSSRRLLEVIPDEAATARFWDKITKKYALIQIAG